MIKFLVLMTLLIAPQLAMAFTNCTTGELDGDNFKNKVNMSSDRLVIPKNVATLYGCPVVVAENTSGDRPFGQAYNLDIGGTSSTGPICLWKTRPGTDVVSYIKCEQSPSDKSADKLDDEAKIKALNESIHQKFGL